MIPTSGPLPGVPRGNDPEKRRAGELVSWCGAVAMLLSMAATGVTGGAAAQAIEEQVTTRLVRVPIALREGSSPDCQGLADGSIEVTEDGLPVGRTYIDPDPPDTIHAILVDAGPLMLESLQEARLAAKDYVRSLAPGQSALLATFDDRLLLHVPSTSDRQRFEQGADWVEVGVASHLWASTRGLIDYLRPQLGRKALVLVTRGCDTEGTGGVSVEDVVAAAEKTESLSIFPIAIDSPTRCESTGTDPLPALATLARRTGGELFRVTASADPGAAFRAIRERLGREIFVLYAPPPFGEGAKDKPQKFTSRWRKLQARVHGRASCLVTVTGAQARCESAPGHHDCVAGARHSARLLQPFQLSPNGETMTARIRDIVHDGGIVVPSLEALFGGPSRRESRREQRERAVSAYLPPLQELLRVPGPEGVILHALAGAPATAQSLPQHWFDEGFLVNGEVLADLREPSSLALAARTDYLAWATGRAREERLAAFDDLIRGAGAESRGVFERARSAIAEGPFELDERETVRYLGGWLGDIPAARVFQIAETLLARQLLAAARTGGRWRLASAWVEVERSWARLGRWVPLPQEERVLAWLVPGYDPVERVVGHYRVVLAQPFSVEIKNRLINAADSDNLATTGFSASGAKPELYDHLQSFNFSREVPLGLWLLRWMLEREEVAGPLLAEFEIETVRYAHSDPRDLRALLPRDSGFTGEVAERPRWARQVMLVVRSREAGGAQLPIGAHFEVRGGKPRDYEREPLCLALFPEYVQDEAQATLLRALAGADRGTSCLL